MGRNSISIFIFQWYSMWYWIGLLLLSKPVQTSIINLAAHRRSFCVCLICSPIKPTHIKISFYFFLCKYRTVHYGIYFTVHCIVYCHVLSYSVLYWIMVLLYVQYNIITLSISPYYFFYSSLNGFFLKKINRLVSCLIIIILLTRFHGPIYI